VLGAPDFLSPEQLGGSAATAASDQYSLAVLAYAMLTGAPPYTQQQDPEVRSRNLARGPVPAHEEAKRSGRAAFPPNVSAVLAKALASAPEERYSSVSEFVQALDAAFVKRKVRSSDSAAVFLSYRREQSAGWANHFAEELKALHSISCFLDTNRADSVLRFPSRIEQAISDCDVFVCFLAAETLGSEWVRREIHLAAQMEKPMLAVFHEDFRHPDSLDSIDPDIRTLLEYDGVHLFDQKNIHVKYTIADLANKVKDHLRPENKSMGSHA
jgi:serine/threonine protein kinase